MTEPGWYANPDGTSGSRYWDGTSWTSQVAPGTTPVHPLPPHGPLDSRAASPFRRLFARFLDMIALAVGGVAFGILGLAGIVASVSGGSAGGLLAILGVLVLWTFVALLYEVICIGKWGQTLGKRAMGIKVVMVTDGSAPTWGAAVTRWAVPWVFNIIPLIGTLVAFGCFVASLVMVFVTENRQTVSDKAARTAVVRI